jgi:hypothetical protein
MKAMTPRNRMLMPGTVRKYVIRTGKSRLEKSFEKCPKEVKARAVLFLSTEAPRDNIL